MADTPDVFKNLLARITLRQGVQIGVAVAAVAGIVWGLSVYATRVRYDVLFSNLRNDDAGPVIAALKEKKIDYRLGSGGTAIEVPAEKVDELRLELAGEGLPRGGGVGFEIFDKPSFGLSEFVQNVNYRRALERELARTIQSLEAVESARVHLALPPQAVFADEKRQPSASVVVRLKAGRALSKNEASAITHLVSSGVEGLEASRVSLIDGNGRMLTDVGSDAGDTGPLPASQLEAKRAVETSLETTLLSILEPVVGAGKARARATVELDMTRVQRVEEKYDPDNAVVRSEQKSKTKQNGSGTGGVPGTASNLPTGTPVAAAGTAAGTEAQTSTVNYEINKSVSTIAEPMGRLAKQSVAIVVDNVMLETTDADGKTSRKSTPRTEEEMRKINDLVRAAVGINDARGDTLIVENIPFEAAPAQGVEAQEAMRTDRWLMGVRVARYAALPIAVLLVILFAVRPGMRALKELKPVPALAAPGGAAPTVAELQARLALDKLPSGGAAGDMRRRLIDAAKDDPEAAALVVRGWLDRGSER